MLLESPLYAFIKYALKTGFKHVPSSTLDIIQQKILKSKKKKFLPNSHIVNNNNDRKLSQREKKFFSQKNDNSINNSISDINM